MEPAQTPDSDPVGPSAGWGRMVASAMLAIAVLGSLTTVRFPLQLPSPFTPRQGRIPLVPSLPMGPRIEWIDCGGESTAHSAECGFFLPSEQGRNYEPSALAFVVFRADSSSRSEGGPVLMLAGGPGAASGIEVSMLGDWEQRLKATGWNRDVFMVDTRGVGQSQPALQCLELNDAMDHILPLRLSMQEELERYAQIDRACVERIHGSGSDLSLLTTKTSVRDLIELSEQLEIHDWNLYGASYGSALAAELMEARPDLVRSAVLDSFSPPSMQVELATPQQLHRVLANLVHEGAPPGHDLAGPRWTQLQQLLASFRAEPRMVHVADSQFSVLVDDRRLVSALHSFSYYGPFASRWAELMKLHEPGSTLLEEIMRADLSMEFSPYFSYAVFLATTCNDDPPLDPEAYRRELERYPEVAAWTLAADAQPVCANWRFVNGSARAPVSSNLPTLFLSSLNDAVTLPEWTTEAATRFSRSFVYRSATTGHGVLWEDSEAVAIMRRFLDDPARSPLAPSSGE